MPDRSWITVVIPTPLIFRYHLPLRSLRVVGFLPVGIYELWSRRYAGISKYYEVSYSLDYRWAGQIELYEKWYTFTDFSKLGFFSRGFLLI